MGGSPIHATIREGIHAQFETAFNGLWTFVEATMPVNALQLVETFFKKGQPEMASFDE